MKAKLLFIAERANWCPVLYLFPWLNWSCGMQSAAPSGVGFVGDENEEYELLDALESEDEKL